MSAQSPHEHVDMTHYFLPATTTVMPTASQTSQTSQAVTVQTENQP